MRTLSLENQVLQLRVDIFSRQKQERDTIPIPSTLNLQFQRGKEILDYWDLTKPMNYLDNFRCITGWEVSQNNEVRIKLVDKNDLHYNYPRMVVKGCKCKQLGGCEGSKACGCLKNSKLLEGSHFEQFKCCPKTCKCSCYITNDQEADITDETEDSTTDDDADEENPDYDTTQEEPTDMYSDLEDIIFDSAESESKNDND
jgi:hypothetical protein